MKTFQNCTLVISAPDKESWPESTLPEVVLAGRSNVGKSSFINTITNRKKLAYVGNTPGKTRLLNFFQLDEELMFVDVPGYGYANTSKQQLIKFGEMMEEYFSGRQQKRGLVIIVDSRHKPSEDDETMVEYARYFNIPIVVVATKIDKVKNSQRKKNLQTIMDTLDVSKKELVVFSSETREGVDQAWEKIEALYKIG